MILPVFFDLNVPGALVPNFEIREHSGKDDFLVQSGLLAEYGWNEHPSLIVKLAFLGARNETAQKGAVFGLNLGKTQSFFFDLIPALGWISNQAIPELCYDECIGIVVLQNFPEFCGYPESAFGVEPIY